MKPGDRICIIGSGKSPTGFLIYATNVLPMNVSIPDHFTHEEARDLLLSVATAYDKARQRLVVEEEANQRKMESLREKLFGENMERLTPTVEQMVDQILSYKREKT